MSYVLTPKKGIGVYNVMNIQYEQVHVAIGFTSWYIGIKLPKKPTPGVGFNVYCIKICFNQNGNQGAITIKKI